MSNKKETPVTYKFYFQFNDEEPVFTKILASELIFTLKGEQSISFIDDKGNAFKIFGRKNNEQ
jgi:hypothetical protein